MIKFFRNIRQRMLRENRISKYLLYAIGEIILVVIGILIALQINNWNNDRLERKQEKKFLMGLQSDLKVDLVNLQAFMLDKNVKATSALQIMEASAPQSSGQIFKLDSLIWNVFRWRPYHPSTNTMDELISSGSLGILKNDSVKELLLNIKQLNPQVHDGTEHMRREYEYYLYDRSAALRELMPYLDAESYIKSDTIFHVGKFNDKNLEDLKIQMENLLGDQIFRNGVKLAILNNHGMEIRCRFLYDEIKKLIQLIDKNVM